MKNIQIAVIGTGAMGKNHLRTLSRFSDVTLSGVCDINRTLGEKIAKEYQTEFFSDYTDLIKRKKPDAICIAVPTSLHKKIALDIIAAQIPLLVEKPLATSSWDAREIITAANQKKLLLLAGHIERYNPVITQLTSLLNKGEFGNILSIIIKRVGIFSERIKDSNVVTDLAVHDLDILCTLLQRKPRSIDARGADATGSGRIDHTEIFLDFSDFGCFIQANWVTPIKIRTLSLTGTKKYAELDFINQTLEIYKTQTELEHITDFTHFTNTFSTPNIQSCSIQKKEPLELELRNFLNAIRGLEPLRVTPEEAYQALVLTELVLQSIQQKKPVTLV